MPSTSVARAIDSAGVVEACEADNRRRVARLQARHLDGVGVQRRRRARKENQRRREVFRLQPRHHVVDRQALRGCIDEPHVAAGIPQQRRDQRERIRRLRRAEHFFTFLAASLSGERDAIDERRIDEEGLATDHV
jgi:hypothetical protein